MFNLFPLAALVQQIPTQQQPLLAGDARRWNRPAAKGLKDRTLSGKAGQATVAGQSYSTLAWIAEAQGSWVLPLRHERITSFETPASKAAFQLKQVTRQITSLCFQKSCPIPPERRIRGIANR